MPFESNSHDSLRRTRPAMLLTAAAALALLLLPQPVLAGEVHFDPDSPAGKEYALPLDRARDEAAGVGESDGPAGEKAPLFGAGVSGGGGGAGGDAGPGAEGAGKGSRDRQSHSTHPNPPVTAAIASADGGYDLSNAILWIVAIVALGGIAGLALRGIQGPRAT
jgi:hypothetical protein